MTDQKETSLRLTLGVLVVVYVFNFLDRQIITILAEPIARDLDLSDTQVGLMTGLSFALFYTILGIPIARYADRPSTNRVRLIAAAVVIWSAMTALCGMAQNFVQLLLARVGVGVGEAGCTPPAISLIVDKAPPEKRARSLATYQLGIPIGSFLGMAIGGLMVDAIGWRAVFVLVGLPGILVGIAVLVLLRDPRTAHISSAISRQSQAPAITNREALGYIFGSRAMVRLLAMSGFAAFAGFGMLIWTAVFLQRNHGLSAGETGLWFGIVNGVASLLGIWAGGAMADYAAARDKRRILAYPAIALTATVPINLLAFSVADGWLALAILFPATFLNSLYLAPLFTCAQGLMPPPARATVSALLLFMQNLFGLGMGPLAVGLLSDALRPAYGADGLRYALYFAAITALAGAALMWSAKRFLPEELDRYAVSPASA